MNFQALRSGSKSTSIGVNYKQYALIFALIFIFILFSFLTEGRLITAMNFNNLVMQNSYVVILAIGMLLCLLVGAIDLSVGSVVALVGAFVALLIVRMDVPIEIAIFAGLLLGALVGVYQGFLIAYVKIPAFIVTLAGMLVFRGIALIMLQSQTVGPLPPAFIVIGAGFIPQWFVQVNGQPLEMVTIIGGLLASVVLIYSEVRNRNSKQKYGLPIPHLWQTVLTLVVVIGILNFFTYKLANHKGAPVVLSILIVLILVYTFVTQRTIVGRNIYAVGGNPEAARLSGIDNSKVIFWVYVNMGVLCALAGIVLAARNASATPRAGDGFELDAIASCFIGGTSTTGGIGNVAGIVVGALIMGVMNNGMSLMGMTTEWQRVIKGAVLLGAVAFDLYNKRRKSN